MRRGVLGDTESMSIKRFATGALALISVGALMLSAAAVLPQTPLLSLSGNQANPQISFFTGGVVASNDKMMASPINYTYVASTGLNGSAGEGKVYQLLLDGTPESALQRAAQALGVSGSVQRSSQWNPESPSYFVGSEDGSSESLNIWWGGTGSWYYNSFVQGEGPACKLYQNADDGSVYCAEYSEQKPTPELLPSNTQVIRDALRVFNSTGLEASKEDIQIYRDEWSVNAIAAFKVAGQESALTWNIGYDSKGRLSWASGHSIRVVDRGVYSTVSAKAAVNRLGDWRWYGSPAQSEFPVYSATARDTSIDQEPTQQPSEVTVTIGSAKPLLLQVWDKNFGSWLVPGFALSGNEGSVNFIVSLVEGVIELPEPIEVQPMIEPMIDETSTK